MLMSRFELCQGKLVLGIKTIYAGATSNRTVACTDIKLSQRLGGPWHWAIR
jgi:hypothetical protein